MSAPGGFHGANPEQLDALARLFEESADRISSLVGSVRALAQEARWTGAAAERFHREVSADLGGAASRASELVRAAGEDIRRNAAEQREASGDVAGSYTWTASGGGALFGAPWPGRGISDLLTSGPVPTPGWRQSPRVSALIDLCDRAAPPPLAGLRVGDLTGAVPAADLALVRPDSLDIPSNWARTALGSV